MTSQELGDSKDTLQDTPKDPRAALDQVLTLLQTKDDTSRFVGLSLLQSLLSANSSLVQDEIVISRCWDAVPSKFLMRLFNAEKKSHKDAEQMVAFAVSIIHAFTILLNQDAIAGDKMLTAGLKILEGLSAMHGETKEFGLRALAAIGKSSKGAETLATSEHMLNLALPMFTDDIAFEALQNILAIRFEQGYDENRILESLHLVVSRSRDSKKPQRLYDLLAAVLESSQYGHQPTWFRNLLPVIHETFSASPTPKLFRPISDILHHFCTITPGLDPFFPYYPSDYSMDSKPPFSYLFVNTTLIDIRATIPLLLETLASPDYPVTALKLAKSYDLLNSFIGALMRTSDDADAKPPPYGRSPRNQHFNNVPPHLLLKLRKDIAETLSLTIEYLRDRWDASRSGAAGLDPSVLPTPSNPTPTLESEKQPKQLTWENPVVSVENDPITLSSTRVLSLWLHEDDNEHLLREAVGIVDVLLALYGVKAEDSVAEYKNHIVLALEPLVQTRGGVEAFLKEDGIEFLIDDIKNCSKNPPYPPRILTAIRTLTIVLRSREISQAKTEWMGLVTTLSKASSTSQTSSVSATVDIANSADFLLCIAELTGTLMRKAPNKIIVMYKKECEVLVKVIESVVRSSGLDDDTRESLEETSVGLREFSCEK